MRKSKLGGTCEVCGASSSTGLYWTNVYIVLDFGVPEMPPMEPDMSQPQLCDKCHELRQNDMEGRICES